ncbi:MAG: transposase [Pseudomonadota bacterium]
MLLHPPIRTNACENSIRPFVIGRRNWLFADTGVVRFLRFTALTSHIDQTAVITLAQKKWEPHGSHCFDRFV